MTNEFLNYEGLKKYDELKGPIQKGEGGIFRLERGSPVEEAMDRDVYCNSILYHSVIKNYTGIYLSQYTGNTQILPEDLQIAYSTMDDHGSHQPYYAPYDEYRFLFIPDLQWQTNHEGAFYNLGILADCGQIIESSMLDVSGAVSAQGGVIIDGTVLTAEDINKLHNEPEPDNIADGEGKGSIIMGDLIRNEATGKGAVAEGGNTIASGEAAHAEGKDTQASGAYSHAAGIGTIAKEDGQTVVGKYNSDDEKALFVVGAGISYSVRSNAFTTGKNSSNEYYITVGSTTLTENQLKKILAFIEQSDSLLDSATWGEF